MMASVPLLVAHRGYPARYPENSLEGLEASLRAGACWVEFDVQLCADGVPVVLHDATLDRTASQSGCIMDLASTQLAGISVHEPERFGACENPVLLPTLAQTLKLLARWPRAQAFVEIKEESLARFGIDAMLRAVITVIRAHSVACTLISYAAEVLAPARAAGLATGWVLRRWDASTQRLAEVEAPDYLICNHKRLPLSAQDIWQGQWHWVSYEVSDPELALALATRGVELIETDAIGAMLGHPLLRTRNCLGE
jgi:glycerophosphoryl diester phosphodiesterase